MAATRTPMILAPLLVAVAVLSMGSASIAGRPGPERGPLARSVAGPGGGSDFNGDGFDDLAIGVPEEDLDEVEDAGGVHVLYGSAAGLTGAGDQFWTQDSPGILDQSEISESFGRTVATGDLNGDGFDDLAIGVPYEFNEEAGDARGGAVTVIYGSAAGLAADAGPGNQHWSQESPGIADKSEANDEFGRYMTVGDFNGDGFGDLSVTVGREDMAGPEPVPDAGAVHVLYGSGVGLTSSGSQFWHQDSPGIPDEAEDGDEFGMERLASGDLDADGFSDLAIAVRAEDLGSIQDAGAAQVLYGSPAGLTAARNQLWTQDSPGVPDESEPADRWGRHLTMADFNNDSFDDLAVAARDEAVGSLRSAGAVTILYGSATGLTAAGSQWWTQDSPGIKDAAEGDDIFGRALCGRDYNGDGFQDLGIGIRDEDVNGVKDAGAGAVLYGSASGLSADHNQFWHQDSSGILDQAEEDDRVGVSCAADDFNNDGFADLVLGTRNEGFDDLLKVGAALTLYGTASGLKSANNHLWWQDAPGVLETAESDDKFSAGME